MNSSPDNFPWDHLDHFTAAALLARHLAGSGPTTLEPIGQGDFCLAFRYGEQIARVARHAEAAEALKREACVLGNIADHLPLPVPRLAYHSPRGCPPFTLHDEIAGEVLTREVWESMPASAQERAAGDLADFLLALHAQPIQIGVRCALPQLKAAELARGLRETAAETISGYLDHTTWQRLDQALENWSQQQESLRLVLLHRDIAPGHLLYDPRSGKLTGIIDFGDLAIGEPARDFIYIYEDFGAKLLKLVLDRYAAEGAEANMQQIQKWYLLEAAAWTIEMILARRSADAADGLVEVTREISQYFSKYAL